MLVQFGNSWIQKIPLTAKLDSAYGLVQFWLSSEFFSSNYFQIGQHVVLLHILILLYYYLYYLLQNYKPVTNATQKLQTRNRTLALPSIKKRSEKKYDLL